MNWSKLRFVIFYHFTFALSLLFPLLVIGQEPVITVRFANPQNSCATEEYCLDVEFKSDLEDQEIFGMNIRFFYDDDVLEFIDFRNFEGGYNPVEPNPPAIAISEPAGPALFNFGGAAVFVNGAMQLTNLNAPPIILDTDEWTPIYQICFFVEEQNVDLDNFCPAVVWDLEQNPINGGFLTGDDGVVITVLGDNDESAPADENVEQFNWEYIGNGSPPYGQPIEIVCSNINCTMPLTMSAFHGESLTTGNRLTWLTKDEINVRGFQVQRSYDVRTWSDLGFVNSDVQGNGIVEYTYLDAYPASAKTYYRLKILDYDASFYYSSILTLSHTGFRNELDFQIYPNPVIESQFAVSINEFHPEGFRIQLYDMTGQRVFESVQTGPLHVFNVPGLPAGVYTLLLQNGVENASEKIIIR